jgi:hypothetical protein
MSGAVVHEKATPRRDRPSPGLNRNAKDAPIRQLNHLFNRYPRISERTCESRCHVVGEAYGKRDVHVKFHYGDARPASALCRGYQVIARQSFVLLCDVG